MGKREQYDTARMAMRRILDMAHDALVEQVEADARFKLETDPLKRLDLNVRQSLYEHQALAYVLAAQTVAQEFGIDWSSALEEGPTRVKEFLERRQLR